MMMMICDVLSLPKLHSIRTVLRLIATIGMPYHVTADVIKKNGGYKWTSNMITHIMDDPLQPRLFCVMCH